MERERHRYADEGLIMARFDTFQICDAENGREMRLGDNAIVRKVDGYYGLNDDGELKRLFVRAPETAPSPPPDPIPDPIPDPEPDPDPLPGDVTVTSAAELIAALNAATGGEVITIDGVVDNFQPDWRTGYSFADPVTIQGGVIKRMKLENCHGLTFRLVTFDYSIQSGDERWTRPFLVKTSSRVVIAHSIVDGDLVAGLGTAQGMVFDECSDCAALNTEFRKFHRGLVVGGCDDMKVIGNDVHSMRSDGTDFYAVQRCEISANRIHDFQGESTDHRDFIQFWTNGTGRPSVDVTIKDNILDIGNGSWAQAIFIRNEEVDNGRAGEEMFYRDFVIENNDIRSAHLHGITTGEFDGLTIRGNTLESYANWDEPANAGHLAKFGEASEAIIPTIRLNPASKAVTCEGNTFYSGAAYHARGNAPRIMNTVTDVAFDATPAGWVLGDNPILPDQTGPLS